VVLTEVAFWPYCYIVIVWVIACVVVFSARELISSICCAQFVFQEDIILLPFWQVAYNSWTDFSRVLIVVKVGVVDVNENGDRHSLE
jgi:hypothetical protein